MKLIILNNNKNIISKLICNFVIILFTFSYAFSQHTPNKIDTNKKSELFGHESEKKEDFNISNVIFDHIQNAHDFHIFTYKEFNAVIPLPIILYSKNKGWDIFMSSKFHHGHEDYNGYRLVKQKIFAVNQQGEIDETTKVTDLSLTKNVVQMFIGLFILIFLVMKAKKLYILQGGRKAPTGIQSFLEPVILFVQNDIAISNLGKHKATKYTPFFLTVFFFILINNLLGLIPGSANVTGNIAFTLVLSVISLIVILFSSNGHFWSHIFWPPGPIFVKVILIPIELIGIFTKPFALMVRLFANMVAGHIIIVCFISLIFIFSKLSIGGGLGFSPVSLLFTVFIYVIEILVAFIQAFIFTNLTAVFIAQAMEGGHEEHNNTEHKTTN